MPRRRRLNPWLPLVGIPALLPDDPTGPDATSGGGAQPDGDPEPDPQPGQVGDLGDGGKRALTAERAKARAAEKRAADAEARLREIDEKNLSEQEKATKRAEEAEQRASAAETRALRLEVVTEKGLPAAMAGRLQGSTKDELLADADALKALLAPAGDGQGTPPPAAPPAGGPRAPRPDRAQGGGHPATTASIQAGVDLYAERKKKTAPTIT